MPKTLRDDPDLDRDGLSVRADGSIAPTEPRERVVDRQERLLHLLVGGPALQAADRRLKRGDANSGTCPFCCWLSMGLTSIAPSVPTDARTGRLGQCQRAGSLNRSGWTAEAYLARLAEDSGAPVW